MKASIGICLLTGLLFSCGEPHPTVTEIEPVFGLTHGGENVIIQGSNLDALMPISVYFGSSRVYMTKLQNSSELWVTTPASKLAQVVDVRIIANDGREFLMQNAFTYVTNADMAECVNISKKLNGKPVLERSSKRN